MGQARPFYPRPGEVFQLVVYLESVEFSALGQGTGHAQGAIAAEGAHLEHEPGPQHTHEHTEQAALQVSARHASVEQVHIGGAPEPVQIVGLRVYVPLYIVVEQVGVAYHIAHASCRFISSSASTASR